MGLAAGTVVETLAGAVVGAGEAVAAGAVIGAAVGARVASSVGWLEEADADANVGMGMGVAAGVASLPPHAASRTLPAARTVRKTFPILIQEIMW